MSLLKPRSRQKKKPFRDSSLYVIVTEGSDRERRYFEYFDRQSPRIRIKVVSAKGGKSAPNHLVENASRENDELDQGDHLWLIMDVDKWIKQGHLHSTIKECRENSWNIAISNPCFEVWLAYHFGIHLPESNLDKCKTWKQFVDSKYGGFDHARHCILVKTAVNNSLLQYENEGFIPRVASTNLHVLCQELYDLCDKQY